MFPARLSTDWKVIATQRLLAATAYKWPRMSPYNLNIRGQAEKKEAWGPEVRRQDVTSDGGVGSKFLGAPRITTGMMVLWSVRQKAVFRDSRCAI